MDEVFALTQEQAENALPIKYNKEYNVIQANELVRSKQDDLTLLEAKLIRLAIAQVLKQDTDLKTYTCNVARLAEFLGISRQNIYKEVQYMSLNLMKKNIFIRNREQKQGKQNYKIFHWIDYIEYKDGDITFKLSEHLKPYLVGLNELFTSYSYEEILRLPTNYAIRLYELLYSYANLSLQKDHHAIIFNGEQIAEDEVLFTIEQLREYFNCQDKYPNTGDFIKRVIKAAIEDINQNTVYPCSYRLIKEHNKIVKVVFKLDDYKAGAEPIETILRQRQKEQV